MDRWLTPDTPSSGFICRRLFIPAGIDWLAIVKGALLQLAQQYNFEEFGTSSVQDTANAFYEMYRKFSDDNQDECPMIGQIMAMANGSIPAPNWLPCDGASLLRTGYPGLFAVIGTTFGAVDSSHFNVPDLRGRVPVGSGTGPGLSTRAVGDSFGEEAHTLTASEMPSHSHSEITAVASLAQAPATPIPSATPGVGFTGSAGGDAAHNNMQPSLVLAYFIVAF